MDYDNWKTTPPDDPEPECCCDGCGDELFEGDEVLIISGEYYCERCAAQFKKIL